MVPMQRPQRSEITMLSRNVALTLAAASLVFPPAAALAKNGADDGPTHDAADDHGGQRVDTTSGRRVDTTSGAAKSPDKRVAGSCTGSSSAKLKAKPDNGRLETEFEVDQNRNGVAWSVQLRRNGKLVVSTQATTKAPSGSFSVQRRLANPAGSDRITARATSPSGEVCTASLAM
jgi:hypothetical protein